MSPTSSSPRIRSALPDDAPALSVLLAQLGYPTAPELVLQRLHSLTAAGETVLVAERDGNVLGLLTVHVTPVLHRPTPVGRLTALVVADRARGQGVGRALVRHAEELLAEHGCALVEVTSNRKRAEAHAFYEHLDYELTSYRFKKSLSAAD